MGTAERYEEKKKIRRGWKDVKEAILERMKESGLMRDVSGEAERARTFRTLEAKVRILFFILRAIGSLRILSREETYQIFILKRSF